MSNTDIAALMVIVLTVAMLFAFYAYTQNDDYDDNEFLN